MPNETQVVERARLTQTAYAALAKVCPPIARPNTDLEAGYMLGVQFVLQRLREGFVIDAA